MAYHLHRLNITATSLTGASGLHRTEALHIRNGRTTLTINDLSLLGLEIPLTELTRSLLPDEQRDWDFYRVSARHSAAVWMNVRTRTENAGFSNVRIAQVLGITRPHVIRAMAGHPSLVLQRPPSQRLAQALSLGTAEIFLEGVTPLPESDAAR